MRRYNIVEGDVTTVGGVVQRHTGNGKGFIWHGKIASHIGDKVICPACGSVGVIEALGPRLSFDNHKYIPALHGDLCICKCSPPPVLVHSQELMYQNVSGSFGTPEILKYVSALTGLAACKFNVSIQLVDKENVPHRRKAYFAVTDSGEMFEGTTDVDGYTTPIYTESQENISFHLLENYDYQDQVPNENL
jgi:hypothetical protein